MEVFALKQNQETQTSVIESGFRNVPAPAVAGPIGRESHPEPADALRRAGAARAGADRPHNAATPTRC